MGEARWDRRVLPRVSPIRMSAVQGTIKLVEVLTIEEVARLLSVTRRTVCLLAQSGDLPAFRFRGAWRFHKGEVIDAFLSRVHLPVCN